MPKQHVHRQLRWTEHTTAPSDLQVLATKNTITLKLQYFIIANLCHAYIYLNNLNDIYVDLKKISSDNKNLNTERIHEWFLPVILD